MQTVRQFFYALLLMAALIAPFHLLKLVDPAAIPKDGVIGGRALRAATIFTGIAHFVIAFLFMWTGTAMARPGARGRLGLALLVGAALCIVCWIGSDVARLFFPSVFVGVYFLAHEVRDELAFSRSHGDVPATGVPRGALLLWIGAVFAWTAAAAWNLPFLKSTARGIRYLRPLVDIPALSETARLAWWLVPVALFLAIAGALFILGLRRAGLTVGAFVRSYRPLLVVYAGLAALFLLDPKSEMALYLIVLFHVAAWWVFTSRKLAGTPRPPGPLGFMDWCKRTQVGFQSIHVGLTIAMLGLAAAWVYGFGRAPDNPLAWIVAPESFKYWTIMHVTVSFLPNKTGPSFVSRA